MFKPFKPPSLLKNAPGKVSLSHQEEVISESPPQSPRRVSCTKAISSAACTNFISPILRSTSTISRSPSTEKNKLDPCSEIAEGYYLVLWRNYTTKKHKTWDGDGVLSVLGGFARLQDISGREMGKITFDNPLLPGSTLSIGGKDIEIESIITKADFEAGTPFIQNSAKRKLGLGDTSGSISKRICAPLSLSTNKLPLISRLPNVSKIEIPVGKFYAQKSNTSLKTDAGFKSPLFARKKAPKENKTALTPRHNPNESGATVMKRPTNVPEGKQVLDVVLDPFLGQHLREHQKDGVKFLYECLMGMRGFNGNGAILADEMGLGKSLTTIALIWTLLKQSPFQGSSRVIEKALIVCPVTLIGNWKKEFAKWLGNERIGVFVMDGRRNKLTDFTHGRSYSVMIVGYEKLRSIQDELKKGGSIDVVVADEGHRLKTAQNKSAQAIRSFSTPKKIILSGTPIQNDLSEFFEMVDFVNPGLLGTYKTFTKEFEIPIVKSRQPGASKRDVEHGAAQQEELSSLTKTFILRRTSEILSKYLPSRTEYILFCKPTQAQIQVYQHVLASPSFGNILHNSEASLQLITLLKKVCNAPSLLINKSKKNSINPNIAELLNIIPKNLLNLVPLRASAKLEVLDRLLSQISQNTSEKIVIVSNYTSTLDLLSQHLTSMALPFLRLDGKTPVSKRQDLVDTFNKTPASKNFAFLLSAKAGGAGLNLIGASRLVLFDVDWNPATDQQAMARIHRDGQKRPVKIYRFLLSGGIDEKIYQRQTTKMGLADSVVDGKKNEASFSTDELRDLFHIDLNSECQTHNLIGCDCKGRGTDPLLLSNSNEISSDDYVPEISDESDSELVYPIVPKMIAGTRANVDAIEQRLANESAKGKVQKAKKNMQALMLYRHYDSSFFRETKDTSENITKDYTDIQNDLGDEVLAKILRDPNTKIAYIFSRKS